MPKKTHIIVQARMGSTRLPGKVLMDLHGQPNLWHVIQRCRAAKKADDVIVATTDLAEDDVIATNCAAWGIPYSRGSSSDVLSRYHDAAKKFESGVIVRVTADCPFVDPAIIDLLIDELGSADYATNIYLRDFPHGLDAEVVTRPALDAMQQEATLSFHREHVTPFIREHEERFTIHKVAMPPAYRFPQFRLTLDTQEDYQLIRRIYAELHRPGTLVSVPGVLRWLLKNPDAAAINSKVRQNHDPTVETRPMSRA